MYKYGGVVGGGLFRRFVFIYILVIVVVICVLASTQIWSVFREDEFPIPANIALSSSNDPKIDSRDFQHRPIVSDDKTLDTGGVRVERNVTKRVVDSRAEKAKTKAKECGINFGSDVSYNITMEEIEELHQEQRIRQDRLMEFCQGRGLDMREDAWLDRAMTYAGRSGVRLQFNDEYKIITCLMPKCGTGSWRNVLLRINPENDHMTCPAMRGLYSAGGIRNTAIRPLSRAHGAELRHKLKTYFKFTFVREPMERLISAFMSKFGRDRASLWPLSKSYWWHVVDQVIRGTPGLSSVAHTDQNAKNTPIDFEDFMNYYSKKQAVGFDQHWKPQTQLCDPCMIKYDFVGHMETLERDANYVIEKATKINERVHYPRVHSHKGHERAAEGYKNISQKAMTQFGRTHYQQDYSAYGYNFCETMKLLGKEC